MHSVQKTHLPLSSYPDDIQQKVLELVIPADLCRLHLVSKTEKAVVDKFSSLLMKKDLIKEGLELKEKLVNCHNDAVQNYARRCQEGDLVNCHDPKYGEMLSIFNRFKTKCEKFLPEIPSVREDSFGLLFSIRNQHPTKLMKMVDQALVEAEREDFDEMCSDHWGVKKNSFDLVDIQKATNLFQGVPIARVLNTQIMMEFVEKSLEAIRKQPTT